MLKCKKKSLNKQMCYFFLHFGGRQGVGDTLIKIKQCKTVWYVLRLIKNETESSLLILLLQVSTYPHKCFEFDTIIITLRVP